MFIFYDFETSSRELLGQILTYAFIVTDDAYNVKEEFTGKIRLNRTQLPEIDAILINRCNIDTLQEEGDSEYEAAHKIHAFLNKHVKRNRMTLAGFNSNQFDLGFLRNILIRYGLNPYFSGKLQNADLLHYAQHLAFNNPDTFPWTKNQNEEGNSYYTFRLESLTASFGLLDGPQSHDALEDVRLTIKLVRHLDKTFQTTLKSFRPFLVPAQADSQALHYIGKQKIRDYTPDDPNEPKKFAFQYWLKLAQDKKTFLFVDLKQYSESGAEGAVRYRNQNKHFFVLESLTGDERQQWQSSIDKIDHDPALQALAQSPTSYFDLNKNDWDIDYKIHELGFDRIDTLHRMVQKLLENPSSYDTLLSHLLQHRNDPKDTYLIQLFNRVYLNFHPDPKPDYLMRYLSPRYIAGTMIRNSADFVSFSLQNERLAHVMKNPDTSEDDRPLLAALQRYFTAFSNQFQTQPTQTL